MQLNSRLGGNFLRKTEFKWSYKDDHEKGISITKTC